MRKAKQGFTLQKDYVSVKDILWFCGCIGSLFSESVIFVEHILLYDAASVESFMLGTLCNYFACKGIGDFGMFWQVSTKSVLTGIY